MEKKDRPEHHQKPPPSSFSLTAQTQGGRSRALDHAVSDDIGCKGLCAVP